MQRVWREAGLWLHPARSFKISDDPVFEEKVSDIAGFHVSPPAQALVHCVGEKRQSAAVDRKLAGLPLK